MMIRASSTEVSLYTGVEGVFVVGVVVCAVVGVLGVVLGDVGFGVVDFSSIVTVEDGSVEDNQGFGQVTDIGGSYLELVLFLGQAYGEISRKYWKIKVMQQVVK